MKEIRGMNQEIELLKGKNAILKYLVENTKLEAELEKLTGKAAPDNLKTEKPKKKEDKKSDNELASKIAELIANKDQ